MESSACVWSRESSLSALVAWTVPDGTQTASTSSVTAQVILSEAKDLLLQALGCCNDEILSYATLGTGASGSEWELWGLSINE